MATGECVLEDYEALCKRCGVCCTRDHEVCSELKRDKDGRFYCVVYDHRFGEHFTVTGKKLKCVPIRDVLNIVPSNCGYK